MKKSQLRKIIKEEIREVMDDFINPGNTKDDQAKKDDYARRFGPDRGDEEIFNGEITKGLIGQEPYYQVEWSDGQRMTIPEENWEEFQRMVKRGA